MTTLTEEELDDLMANDVVRKDLELDRFEDLYDDLNMTSNLNGFISTKSIINRSTIGKLTVTLYEAGVDPLSKMKVVPPHFLHMQALSEFEVPEHIVKIAPQAFMLATIDRLIIHKNTDVSKSSLKGIATSSTICCEKGSTAESIALEYDLKVEYL